MRVRDVLGPGSPLRAMLPAYEDRPAQLAMAEAVEAALLAERPLFVEAGTGTGKTLAYLLPALLSGKKVVVSTATKALQEQIFEKDLPLVAEVLAAHGIRFRAALMKGLANYLCRRRFQELRKSPDLSSSGRRWLPVLEKWALDTETGDRAELADLPEDAEVWREVQSSTDTRIGAECSFYDECFVTAMRRDAEEAQLVVVNHHLFLADLALRTGKSGEYASAIPAYDAVVFDEAHQLEDIATEFFGVKVSTSRFESLIRDAHKSLLTAGLVDPVLGTGAGRSLLDQLHDAAREFFKLLADGGAAKEPSDTKRILTPEDWTEPRLAAKDKLVTCLEALESFGEENQEHESMKLLARRIGDLRTDLDEVVEGSRKPESAEEGRGRDARIAWVDVRDRSVSIGSSPIDLGRTLRNKLFERVQTVVLTSATLATAVGSGPPSFHFARARLGAPPEARELIVPSPFDYPSRAALYVPRDLPEPTDPRFEPLAAERILELIDVTGGGAFLLCTSVRAMKGLHNAIPPGLKVPLLLQGQAPKSLLLSRFRAAGNAVLVATMSFWEGVDVPGRALRLVMLDKIPFAVPTDPVFQARAAHLERQGGNAFAQLAIPGAAITLKQGFGRLLRTERDAGIVALLDRRVITKGYGKALLRSLPPARRVASLEDVRAFWSAVDRDAGDRHDEKSVAGAAAP